MKLSEIIHRDITYAPPAKTSLKKLEATTSRILARWPDVIGIIEDRDREALVQFIRAKLETDQWEGTKLSTVTRAARVVFDPDFRNRADLSGVRDFYIHEVAASNRATFLSGMLSVYFGSFQPNAPHTIALSKALYSAWSRLNSKSQKLLSSVPELINPYDGPARLGQRMTGMECPWADLKSLGISSPHGTGFMEHAHVAYVKELTPQLERLEVIDRLLDWLKPEGREAKASGAMEAIEAMLHPWLKTSCPDNIREYLVENLIAMFGDPRVSNSAHWLNLATPQKDLMFRWLTRADMEFFIGVVTATQPSHMWPPRRDYWMKRYHQGRIDAAWIAFCPSAAEYARIHLLRTTSIDVTRRFGRQTAGGGRFDTSLLIMKIGNKIVVDGCHSYKTHIFNASDPKAPTLFGRYYDCEEIRQQSMRSRTHHPINNWIDWVEVNT
jgi:hypothetical protein